MSDSASLSDDAIVRAVADDLPVGVWVARAPSGQFVYANKQFAEIMGMAGRDDVAVGEYAAPYGIHSRDGSLYPEDKMPFVRALEARAVVTVDDIVIHRSDGRRVNIRAQARPVFDASGTLTHVVIAFIDITREVVAEAARQETEGRLFHAQKMDSIGTLAGGVAHDFNNLLGAMKILVGILRRDIGDVGKRQQLDELERIADSAAALTKALLGFAQRGRNLSQPVSLNDLVGGVARLLARTLDPSIVVTTQLRAEADVVLGDASQLQQALMNLAINARDAMPDGGRLVFRTRDAAPSEHAELGSGPHVVVEVQDGGTGIDPAIRARIFEPYFTTKAGAQGGTGLGLAMTYGIVASHKGAITPEDAPGGGTCMRLVLPVVPGASVPAPAAVRAPSRGAGTVLLVDDDSFVRQMSTMALGELGYRVLPAVDGAEGVELFLQHKDEIAAVVLDMTMPRMDGRATYEALRALDPGVRVLLVTGHALNDEAQRILDLGVRGFLAKPYSLTDLSEALLRVLGRDAEPSDE